ncbi:RNA polymerase sigma factor SigJ [Actinomadura sp. NTSP31]|uniref:RNA polymerase sigma factor SigJ n=1 Tax=Actinomadura sp. NTSP31 TaxID=1735447 RepID=UPI0035C0E43D
MDGEEDGFAAHRDLMMGVAYRMLGRVTDAEDVVQEAWLRWSKVDAEAVADPEAFLVKVTTRLAIDRLRRVRAARETYVGEWLPEPLRTVDDAADDVVRAESVSLALLVVLETLSPLERAVFVLREIFGFPYAEIAATLDRAEPAVRQLASRARANVRARRPRFDVDPIVHRRVTDAFVGACLNGTLDGLLALLAPDVRLIADGGGEALAPRRVVTGSEPVARFLLRVLRLRPGFFDSVGVDATAPIGFRPATVNGLPAILLTAGERVVVCFQLEVTDGAISACYLIVNPRKLTGVLSQDGWALRP